VGTDQGKATNFIYVWNAGGPPAPDTQGRYPNSQSSAAAAIPVYEVTTPPADTPPYPNGQGAISNISGAAQGAIPVKFTTQPTGNGPFPNDPTKPQGAIPVWVIPATPKPPTTGPYPNAQDLYKGALPVYVVV
jgi:hypothetical protein